MADMTFEGKDYDFEDLSDKAKVLVGRLELLKGKSATLQAELDILTVAETGLIDMLREELATDV